MANTEKAAGAPIASVINVKLLKLDSFGMMLVVAWFGAVLWTPSVIPTTFLESGADVSMHLYRLIFLVAYACVYLAAQFKPEFVLKVKSSTAISVFAAITSSLVSLPCIVPNIASLFHQIMPLPYIAWALAGISASLMMLVWCYGMRTKEGKANGTTNVVISAIFAGAFYILLAFLQKTAAAVLVLVVPFVILALRVSARKSFEQTIAIIQRSYNASNLRVAMGTGSPIFVFSYGLSMGLTGALATQLCFADCSFFIMGVSSILSGIFMITISNRGIDRLRTGIFTGFLPFISVCLFCLSLSIWALQVVLLFLLYFLVQTFNSINTASSDEASEGSPIAPASQNLFADENRMWDALGSLIGWGFGILIVIAAGTPVEVYLYFGVTLVFVFALTGAFFRTYERFDPSEEEEKEPLSEAEEWEAACKRVAEAYSLSPREQELLILLSRGRNRDYISEQLFLSPNTVRTHTYNIYNKLSVHKQQELISIVEEEIHSPAK